jgi:hypothetical protein
MSVTATRRRVVAFVLMSACATESPSGTSSFSATIASTDEGAASGETTDAGGTGAETSTGAAGSEGLDEGTTAAADTASFVPQPDAGGTIECDIWTQDCPAGEKCMPYASGTMSWDATRCSPVDAMPNQVGDPCTVVGNDSTGEDDCVLGAMCFAVDPESNEGVCYAMCQGSEANATCEDPAHVCSISNEGVLALCLPSCNPLLQDCPMAGVALGCYPVQGIEGFVCWPDYSFDQGGFGDPCEYFNYCDVGLFCGIPEALPGCVATACCNEYCDITGATPCSGAADGQECIAWYDAGQAPPGYEDVGYCGLP